MSEGFPYDDTFDPPAPVIALRVARPGDAEGIVVAAIVDSGADCTLVPTRVARALGLPHVGYVALTGVGGAPRSAPVHAAVVELAGRPSLARVIAFEQEAIVGRDLLATIVTVLDGPRQTLRVQRPLPVRAKRARRA